MARSNTDKQTSNIAVMQTDICYIKKSIDEIKNQLVLMDSNFVKKDDLNSVKEGLDSIDKDHEVRLRRLETWGFTAIGALAVIQFALNYFK
mgnify:CR=1 FL=1